MAIDLDFESGDAGASARREYERRKANRERRIREQHPRIGGAVLALSDEPQHQRAWAVGAEGEAAVAATLMRRCHTGVFLLHDRRVPGTRANIDHIAVTPSGVWVIDAKRHKGKAEVRRPLFGKPRLLIRGRDQSKLADGLARQVELVTTAVAHVAPDVEVRGVFCMVEADLPLLGTVSFRGYPLLRRRALAKRLNSAGPVSAEQARVIASVLAQRLPSA